MGSVKHPGQDEEGVIVEADNGWISQQMGFIQQGGHAYRPHEAEDVWGFPDTIKDNAARDPSQSFSVMMAMATATALGVVLGSEALDPNNPLASFDGRRKTFPGSWSGAPPADMALAGLYYDSGTGCAKCGSCGVRFRTLNQPGSCPWSLHQQLAPSCLHLVRYQSHGTKPTNVAKRRRHSSTSSACDMTQQNKKMMSPGGRK